MTGEGIRTTVAVAVCTCNRNGPLEALLNALLLSAERVRRRAAVGVVVVDDARQGTAGTVVERFDGQFELGITYRLLGKRNVAQARNLAIDVASSVAAWVAMTDDDCEPSPDWLDAFIEAQESTGADAIAGRYLRRVSPGAPAWLTDEPFLEIGEGQKELVEALFREEGFYDTILIRKDYGGVERVASARRRDKED